MGSLPRSTTRGRRAGIEARQSDSRTCVLLFASIPLQTLPSRLSTANLWVRTGRSAPYHYERSIQKDLRVKKYFSLIQKSQGSYRVHWLPVGHMLFPPFCQARLWEDSGEWLRVIWHWERLRGGRGEATSVASINALSTQSRRLHSGSLFLIIRANYVQAKTNMFLNLCLCVWPRQCVFCVLLPEKLLQWHCDPAWSWSFMCVTHSDWHLLADFS
jgi:hypothetical protein